MDTAQQLDRQKMPRHVAIIMDGNGRWAKSKGMMRIFGHRSGTKSVREVVRGCVQAGVPYLTLYAFSQENWSRPADEVDALMGLLASSLDKEVGELHAKGVRVRMIGEMGDLPANIRKSLEKAMDLTRDNTQLNLILALSYGSRKEMEHAVREIARRVHEKEINVEDIDQKLIAQNLYAPDVPDVDLLIRTSGEKRISNFLLWQIAYAELFFTDTLWPDFKKEDLFNALEMYQQRERRFGKTSEQLSGQNL